jgi:hypothetical protein
MRLKIIVIASILGAGFQLPVAAQTLNSDTQVADFTVIQPVSPALHAGPGDEIIIPISGWGDQYQLVLEDNQRLLEPLPKHRRDAIRARGDRFFAGKVAGKPGSWVRMNWVDGQFSGAFYDGQEMFLIDSPSGFSLPTGRMVDPSATLLMRLSDLQLDGLFDQGPLLPGKTKPLPLSGYEQLGERLRKMAETEALTLLSMPVTIVADTFFEDDLGAAAEATAIARLNFVDGIYSDQLGIGIVLWHFEQLTDNGPLTSTDSGPLLGSEFRPFMVSGAGSSIPFKGLAHLFTGRDMDGSTVGRAYLGVLCSRSFGYGINQNLNNATTSALVFAHELGHNFAANHVSEGIMQSTITGTQQFSDESLGVMSAAAANASCLVDGGLRIFEDSFE